MLERLFTSKARVRILEVLLFYPEKNFYLREICRLAEENPNAVRRELENLLHLSIVKRYRKGRIIFYEINRQSPFFEPLRILFTRTESLGRYLKGILESKKIIYALVFGSFAEGKETEKSDIDLLIVGDIEEEKLIEALSDFERRMLREVNYIWWREGEFFKRVREKHYLLEGISNKPVIMLVGDENEFRKAVKRR